MLSPADPHPPLPDSYVSESICAASPESRPPSVEIPSPPTQSDRRGLAIALALLGTWLLSTVGLMAIDLSGGNNWIAIPGLLWQMLLFSGLFVTAHDAMHGIICPQYPRLNDWIGSIAVKFYALFSYSMLKEKHWEHHSYPASELDPDYYRGDRCGLWLWYGTFMMRYWGWGRFLGFTLIYNLLKVHLHVEQANLLLFWVVPSLLSSLQLFYFGTYLPHKPPKEGFPNEFRATSIYFPYFWSLVTCYHFCYHEEHHRDPNLPWWRLPEARIC